MNSIVFANILVLCVMLIQNIFGQDCPDDNFIFADDTVRTINSPGSPNNYPNNADCRWTIAARNGRQVYLELAELDLESCCDFLEITDGPNEVGRFSGRFESEFFYISTNNQLVLRFESDRSVNNRGFRANFKAVDACGGNLNARSVSQSLLSPNFPNYGNNLDCLWVITAGTEAHVELTILELATQECCDFMQIYEVSFNYIKLAGSNLPNQTVFTSKENKLFVYFHSDGAGTGRGFRTTYKEVSCGGTFSLTGREVNMITSPGYPVSYEANANCEYIFEGETGLTIEIEINAELEATYDLLRVFDGGVLQDSLSGIVIDYRHQSEGNSLRIVFTSDRSIQRSGFQIRYNQAGNRFAIADSRRCSATGDPHYTTFDRKLYDFHGICSYVMTQYNATPGTKDVSFMVEVFQHNLGGSVAYIEAVVVTIDDLIIKIFKSGMMMDGDKQINYGSDLPSKKVSMKKVGNIVLVKTTFGLSIEYHLPHNLYIDLSTDYDSRVSGLCGNHDGVSANDFPLNPFISNRHFLNESYANLYNTTTKMCDTPNHSPPVIEACPEKANYRMSCSLLEDESGPYSDCISRLNPTSYIEDCIFDACAAGSLNRAMIEIFGDYEAKCLSLGVMLGETATDDTRVVCPKNQIYVLNANDCQPSCSEPNPTDCNGVYRACVCDEGFVLSDTECVRLSECGCKHEGNYYKNKESFFNDDCSQHCECQETSMICKRKTCEEGSSCRKDDKDGKFNCIPDSKGTGTMKTDPHFTTFDGNRYDFMGVGKFILIESTGINRSDPRWFKVESENRKPYESTSVSWIREVTMKISENNTVQLRRNQVILLNGEPIQGFQSQLFRVQISGWSSIIATRYGVVVSFSYNHTVQVTVPSTYGNQTRGLFGNYDGMDENDIFGESIEEINNFAREFQVGSNAIYPNSSFTCSIADTARWSSNTQCGQLTDASGPFSACHSTIQVENYFENCVFDVCISGGNRESLISAFESYASACLAQDVRLCDWRERTGSLNQMCPENSHYEGCASPCPNTCASPFAFDDCNIDGKVEACVCNFGFVRDGGECILPSHCNSVDIEVQVIPGKTYFGVVVDTTGSMGRLIQQITSWLSNCTINSNCGFKATGGWIFSPFNDPESGPVVGPTNTTEFLRAVNEMQASGGGDCPEKGFTGILNALLSIPSDSVFCRLLYFSDAIPYDIASSGHIQTKMEELNCELTVFQKSCCGTCPEPNGDLSLISNKYTRELYRIADISGGRVVLIPSTLSTDEFAEFVESFV